MTKAIAYVRASTEEQHLGPEAQEAAYARWCEANSVQSAGVFRDLGVSGGQPIDKRPGLQAAVVALDPDDVTVLWVYDRTRLARDMMVALTVTEIVRQQGARVLTAGDSVAYMPSVDDPDFQLNQGVRDLFSAHERAKIRFRTKAALAVLKSKGQVYGRVPFGWRRGCRHTSHPKGMRRTPGCSRLVPDKAALKVLRKMQKWHDKGLGYTAIARRLNKAGHRSASGGVWYASSVKSVLTTQAAA